MAGGDAGHAILTVQALCDVTTAAEPTMHGLLTRKAELIVERAAAWEREHAPELARP
jgi:hypothetical protein